MLILCKKKKSSSLLPKANLKDQGKSVSSTMGKLLIENSKCFIMWHAELCHIMCTYMLGSLCVHGCLPVLAYNYERHAWCILSSHNSLCGKVKSFVLLSRLIANRIVTLLQFEEKKNIRNGRIDSFVSWMASLITVNA